MPSNQPYRNNLVTAIYNRVLESKCSKIVLVKVTDCDAIDTSRFENWLREREDILLIVFLHGSIVPQFKLQSPNLYMINTPRERQSAHEDLELAILMVVTYLATRLYKQPMKYFVAGENFESLALGNLIGFYFGRRDSQRSYSSVTLANLEAGLLK